MTASWQEADGRTHIEYIVNIDGADPYDPAYPAMTQQVVDRLGPTTSRLHLLFGFYAAQSESRGQSHRPFSIPGKRIEECLGLDKKRRAGTRQRLSFTERRAIVEEQVRDLGSIDARVTRINLKSRGGGGRTADLDSVNGRVWNVYTRTSASLTVDENEEVAGSLFDYCVEVVPGQWARAFLDGDWGRYFAHYPTALLQSYDERRGDLAFWVCLYLCDMAAINREASTVHVPVQRILNLIPETEGSSRHDRLSKKNQVIRACIDQSIWGFTFVQGDWPDKLWQQVEKEIGTRESAERLTPNYWDTFVQLRAVFEVSTEILERRAALPAGTSPKGSPKRTSKKGGGARRHKSAQLTQHEIKAIRKAKKWSQRRMAEFLGVSRQYVGHFEQGIRSVPPEVAQKLHGLRASLPAGER